jgi:hypothetical protein
VQALLEGRDVLLTFSLLGVSVNAERRRLNKRASSSVSIWPSFRNTVDWLIRSALAASASEPQSAIAFTMRKSSHDGIHHNSRQYLGLRGFRH